MSRYLLVNPKNRDSNYTNYSLQMLKKQGGKNIFTKGKGAAVSAIPEDELRKIKSQTLIIWGEYDKLFSISHGETAARIIPNAKLHRIHNADHLPLMNQPKIFNKTLLQFLLE